MRLSKSVAKLQLFFDICKFCHTFLSFFLIFSYFCSFRCKISIKIPTHPPFDLLLAEWIPEPCGKLVDFGCRKEFGIPYLIRLTGHIAIDSKPSCKLLVGYLRLLFDFLHLLLQSFSECTFAVLLYFLCFFHRLIQIICPTWDLGRGFS